MYEQAVVQPQLPTQDQLYAYYLQRCGHHGVVKPNASMLRLLADVMCPNTGRTCTLPLALRTTFRLPSSNGKSKTNGGDDDDDDATMRCDDNSSECHDVIGQLDKDDTNDTVVTDAARPRVHVGARGMMAVLDVLAVLPRVTMVDLSNVTSWFSADAYVTRARYDGNDVVRHLCAVLRCLPNLCCVDIRGQPLGCAAAQELLAVVHDCCPRLTRLGFTRDGVAGQLCVRIDEALQHNQRCREGGKAVQLCGGRAVVAAADTAAAAAVSTVVTSLPATLPLHDRKTLREQQALYVLLTHMDAFTDCVTAAQLSALVLHARVLSTSAVVTCCSRVGGGVRGDGEHLFVVYTGALHVAVDARGVTLRRGAFFGDTYDSDVVFAASPLREEVRGCVYALPLSCCDALLAAWSARVRRTHDALRRVPLLQSVGAWSRVRACTCARVVVCSAGDVVVRAAATAAADDDGKDGDTNKGKGKHDDDDSVVDGASGSRGGDGGGALCIVLRGKFVTRCPVTRTTQRARHDTCGRRAVVSFTPGDVFGFEALVARNGRNSVAVVATAVPPAASSSSSSSSPSAATSAVVASATAAPMATRTHAVDANEQGRTHNSALSSSDEAGDAEGTATATHVYVRITGCGVHVLVAQLHPVLCALVRPYSQHADLCGCVLRDTAADRSSPPLPQAHAAACNAHARRVAALRDDDDATAPMYFL